MPELATDHYCPELGGKDERRAFLATLWEAALGQAGMPVCWGGECPSLMGALHPTSSFGVCTLTDTQSHPSEL